MSIELTPSNHEHEEPAPPHLLDAAVARAVDALFQRQDPAGFFDLFGLSDWNAIGERYRAYESQDAES